jgi:hypothetical protein
MLACPHCASPVTFADLYTARLLRPKTCRACGGQFVEGGTTLGMAFVGAGGGLAVSVAQRTAVPPWVSVALVIACTLLGLLCNHVQPPRRVGELRRRLTLALVAGPIAALVVWQLVALVAWSTSRTVNPGL